LELLVSLVPGIARFAAFRNPGNPAGEIQWKETEEAAHLMRMVAKLVDVAKADDLERAFTRAAEEQASGAVLLADPLFLTHRALIADLAIKHRLAMISARRENVEAGLLASYGPSLRDQFRQASHYVDLIFKGFKPADLPVQQPTTFELALNRKTANVLGLSIPPTLLARADEVIE
jgi:putative ABC transport system substrate-binding protein